MFFNRKEIGDGKGNVFFWRHTVFKCRWFAVYFHQFLRGDQDRCLHDHPWSFVSFIVWRGYWEEMADGLHWRRPGSILVRPAKTAHRVVVEPGTKPWSLVIVGRKSREWGFHESTGWVPWKPGYSPICETEVTP